MTYRNDTAATKQTAGGHWGQQHPESHAQDVRGSSTGPGLNQSRVGSGVSERLGQPSSSFTSLHCVFPPAGTSSPSTTAQNHFPPSTPQVFTCHSIGCSKAHTLCAAQHSSCPLSAGLAQDLGPGKAHERQTCHVDAHSEVYNRKNTELNISEP